MGIVLNDFSQTKYTREQIMHSSLQCVRNSIIINLEKKGLQKKYAPLKLYQIFRTLFTPASSPIKHNTLKVAEYFNLNTAEIKYLIMFAKKTPDSLTADGNVLDIENAKNIRDTISFIDKQLLVEHEGIKYHFLADMARYDVRAVLFKNISTIYKLLAYNVGNSKQCRELLRRIKKIRIKFVALRGSEFPNPISKIFTNG